jgi:hypothetical protein
MKSTCRDWFTGELIQLKLHPNTMKREDGLSLSRSWKRLIHFLRERKNNFLQGPSYFLLNNTSPPRLSEGGKRLLHF